jgi:UDP-N-acetylmuramoyl-tripeptide--D-alanyl-D-alanine ligase
MISLAASKIAEIVEGKLYGEDISVTAAPVFNSTQATDGSIFLALKGPARDGHDFVSDAFAHGAVLAFTTSQVSQRCIVVDDVTKALGMLAAFVRDELKNLKVIAITGSQGKTTTKDLLSHLLSSQGSTVAPQGNFNNEIGAPLTILECTQQTKFCIVEMGARHIGDIAALCQMAKPDIGVVLKVGRAHVGEFGSQEAIAKAKSEMISSLQPTSLAILGGYDEFTPKMAALHKGQTVLFGEKSSFEVRATDIEVREGRAHFDLVTPQGRAAVGLQVVGLHQIANALAVAAIAEGLGFNLDLIAQSLSMAKISSKWRMEIHEFDGKVLINDCYNASPESMEAALRSLILFAQERGGEAWAFLGKMHELGESSASDHARVGTLAQELGVDHLVCIGAPEYARDIVVKDEAAESMSIHYCADIEQAQSLSLIINAGDVALIKASRSEHLELLSDYILKHAGGEE